MSQRENNIMGLWKSKIKSSWKTNRDGWKLNIIVIGVL